MPGKSTGNYAKEVCSRLGGYLDDYIRLCSLVTEVAAGSTSEEINAFEEYSRMEILLQSRITASANILTSISSGGYALPSDIREKIDTAEVAASQLRETLMMRKGDVGRQLAGIRKNTSASSSLRTSTSASGRYLNISI